MKILPAGVVQRFAPFFASVQKGAPLSLAFFVSHFLLRLLLLFRSNPYGFPFVSKPDWYIFHAVCLDFIWIANALVVFALLSTGINAVVLWKSKSRRSVTPNEALAGETVIMAMFALFHSTILLLTLLDDEVQRFLGSHLSFGIMNTYKDTSSIKVFGDYVANDYSVPYLQFFVLVLILPFTYGVYRLLRYWMGNRKPSIRKMSLLLVVLYALSYLFVYIIWTGNARMTKLRPVVSLIYSEMHSAPNAVVLDSVRLEQYGKAYQRLWLEADGDSLWTFPQTEFGRQNPLYRIPSDNLVHSARLRAQRDSKPNFIVIFLESHRGMNTGFLNPGLQPSPTPFFDSLAGHARIWERMYASGIPTTGGLLSTHTGIPHHSHLAEATDLAHVRLPSFISVLADSGYAAHYFSAADPAWDNLGVWMSKWYNAQHYSRDREDDSTFFVHATSYIKDTLARQGGPFVATLMTRSNHYPFNFAAGMTEAEKQKPLTERINITMHYTDRQLAHFMHAIEKEPWFRNTYVVILADHAFPLGENGVSTMNGGGFSNATWIPFLIYGNGIAASRDTATTAQIDIAPTILELAGVAAPNVFMGHNLLRDYGTGTGLSLGAYSRVAAIGYQGYRLIAKYPTVKSDASWLFAEPDTHQKHDLAANRPEDVIRLKALLDTLVSLSDYTLERGL